MKKPVHTGHDDDGPDSPTQSRTREEALRPAPTLGYDWDTLARHMLSIEALPVAEAQLRRAVWLNPFEWRFKQHLALCLFREKRYAEAKQWLLGFYYLVRDVLVAFAAFGGALLWQVSPALNLWIAFAFGVIGTLWFVARGRDCVAP